MFDIFGKGNGFFVPVGSGVNVLEEIKEEALNGMKRYDSLINLAGNMEEQKRFLENERDCYMAFLDSGYGVIIMWRLLEAAPTSVKEGFRYGDDWSTELRVLREQIQLTFLSINAISGIIKGLAMMGSLKLGDMTITPPADDYYDFLDDGFDYTYEPSISDMLDTFSVEAKKRMENTMRGLERAFVRENLSREQKFYFDFEAKTLLTFLKEYFRVITYQAMVSSDISTELIEGDKILIGNSLARMSVVIKVIELLTTHGLIQLSNKTEG